MVLTVILCNWLAAIAVAPVAHTAAGRIRIVAFGDSLTAGYQLAPRDAFPAVLQRALEARGHNVEVINAGVSGDTTSAAVGRLQWSVPDGVDAVIVELGANDALRGLDPAKARANLDRIIAALKGRGIEVLLAGMYAPRGLGEAYTKAFDAIYADLAAKHGVLLYPFFLDGVALTQGLNLADGLHPNAKGVQRIVQGILPSVEKLIERTRARQAAKGKG